MSQKRVIVEYTHMQNRTAHHIAREIHIERNDIWKEGKWLDLWSVVHFMSGISIGFGFYFLNLGNTLTFLVALASLVLYEGWEIMEKIEETPNNRVMDVIIGMLGFIPAYYFVASQFTFSMLVLVFLFALALNITLSVAGWRASQKAERLKKRLHERYAIRIARLMERRARLRARFGKHKKAD